MKFGFLTLPAALGILLSSCSTLGPDYKEPDVDWLKNWEPAGYDGVTNAKARKAVD